MRKRKNIVTICVFLVVILLCGSIYLIGKNSFENRLFSEYFVDAPAKSQAMGIAPALGDRDEEMIQASKAAGVLTPVLPTTYAEGQFYQRTRYLDIRDDTQCRCTYFIFVQDGDVKSLWIEAAYVENGRVASPRHIFSAKTSGSDILSFLSD